MPIPNSRKLLKQEPRLRVRTRLNFYLRLFSFSTILLTKNLLIYHRQISRIIANSSVIMCAGCIERGVTGLKLMYKNVSKPSASTED